MRNRVLITILALLVMGSAFGQRRYFTIDPTEDDDELAFDVNSVPVDTLTVEINSTASSTGRVVDLNYSPNLLVSEDSSKAFVSYSGSNKIMVFDPKQGDIIQFLEVGDNPSQLTLSPDGKQIAVVSLFIQRNIPQPDQDFASEEIGSVSIIDIETLSVREAEFLGVGFSFANNLVYSQDGETLYIASALTDEVLQIDVATLTEKGPRLEVLAGSRPTSLTMAPDYSFMAVVQVGSPNLDIVQFPDSVSIIDLPAFSVADKISPPTGTGTEEINHDFTATTSVVISADGQYGLLVDQRNSSLSPVPELAVDRAWLIDFSESDFVEVFRVGGAAAMTTQSPSGEFLVVAGFDLTLIDPVERTSRKIIPTRSNFRPRSRPVFSKDGSKIFIAAPLDDIVMRIDVKTASVDRFVEVGGDFKREERTLASSPLEIAFTPDGTVLLSVNYNRNTIDLVKDTVQLYAPSLSNEEFFTGVALTNTDLDEAEVVVTGLAPNGVLFSDDDETEEVEFENPRTVNIPAGLQTALTTDEIFVTAADQRADGSLDIDSDQRDVKAFFLFGDHRGRRLDGSVALRRGYTRVIVPEVRVNDGMLTELGVLNLNRGTLNATVNLVGPDGEVISTFNRILAPRGLLRGLVKDEGGEDDLTGLFPDDAFDGFEHGYIEVTAPHRFAAFGRYYDSERMSSLNGFGASEEADLQKVQYLSQFAHFQGNETHLSFVNSIILEPAEGEEEVDEEEGRIRATLTLKSDSGEDLAVATIDLLAGETVRMSAAELFGLVDDGSLVSGWIVVSADKPGLIGAAELKLYDGKAMTSIPLQSERFVKMVFSHVAQGLGLSTGLALINPGAEDVVATIQILTSEGALVDSTDVVLGPGVRTVRQLNEFFPGFGEQIGGFIQVVSDGEIMGLELFFRNDLELISAVLPQ